MHAAPADFAAEGQLPLDALAVSVGGLGALAQGLDVQQAQALRWCAFYADCRHEVKPVQEGWRVVLSVDLVLPSPTLQAPATAHPALVKAMREAFVAGESLRQRPARAG